MNTALAILNVVVLIFIAYRVWRRDESNLKIFFWPAFVSKLCAGILLGLIYQYYYAVGDTFTYFEDGVKLAGLARRDVMSYIEFMWSGNESLPVWSELAYQQPRAMFLSKITSVFCLISADNYWVIALHYSAISFFSIWLFVKKVVSLSADAKRAVVFGFLFFPSVVFWSAGLIKESLAIAALIFLCFIFLKLWMGERIEAFEWPVAAICVWCLWNLKYYYLAVLLPVTVTLLLTRLLLSWLKVENLTVRILLSAVIFIGPLLFVSILHPNFYPARFIDVVVSSYYQFQAMSDQQDVIHFPELQATPLSILQNIPLAIFSGLFRPFITEAQTAFQYIIAIENLLLLILSIGALSQIKTLVQTKHRLLLFGVVAYVILLCTFLALSAPNFGTLSRYRVGFLPFFILLVTLENPLITRIMGSKSMRNLVP